MKTSIVATVLAAAALGASAGAHAFDATRAIHVQVQGMHGPAVKTAHRSPQPVEDGAPQGYYEPRYRERRHAQARCGAPRWDPSVRYMPGQVVWRRGELWMARGISARVYNENSPPEWTPNYWRPAVCG